MFSFLSVSDPLSFLASHSKLTVATKIICTFVMFQMVLRYPSNNTKITPKNFVWTPQQSDAVQPVIGQPLKYT